VHTYDEHMVLALKPGVTHECSPLPTGAPLDPALRLLAPPAAAVNIRPGPGSTDAHLLVLCGLQGGASPLATTHLTPMALPLICHHA
jgi:hypothetical protein